MTSAAVEAAKLEETKRHNQAGMDEQIGRITANTLGSAGIGALGRVAAAAIKKNDPEFYKRVIELFDSATLLSFPIKKGFEITDGNTPFPSIAVLNWVPTIGTVKDTMTNTPVMKAFKKLFDIVRGKNSGSTNYDSIDLGIVCLAIDSLQTCIDEAIRALRTAHMTKELNPITRRNLCKTLGYNFDSLVGEKQRWINDINKAINDLNSLIIPGGLSYFMKHQYISSYIFTEKDIKEENYNRTTYYAFNCRGYFTYDEATGSLQFNEKAGGNNMNAGAFETYVNGMTRALINSSAVAIMTGDIQNAVDKGAISPTVLVHRDPISLIDIDGVEPLHYDKDMLMQIRNASIAGKPYNNSDTTEFSINQNTTPGYEPYVYQGTLQTNRRPQGIRTIETAVSDVNVTLNNNGLQLVADNVEFMTGHDVPSQDEIIESTRLMFTTEVETRTLAEVRSQGFNVLNAHGSEIVTDVEIWWYNGFSNYKNDIVTNINLVRWMRYNGIANFAGIANIIECFKYLPRISILYVPSSGTQYAYSNYHCYNYRMISDKELQPIHECALRSEFDYSFNTKIQTSDRTDRKPQFNKTNKKKNKNYKNSKKDKKDKNFDKDKK